MTTNYTQLMAGLAAYIPASPPGYAEFPVSPAKEGERPLPAGLVKDDLNFLVEDGALFHYDKALVSAGLVLGKNSTRIPNPMITDIKNRLLSTMVLWDSGGFQLITDKMEWRGDETRRHILQAQEHYATVAASLDIPPFGKSAPFPDL